MPTLHEEKGVGKTIDSIKKDIFKKKNWELEITIIDGLSKDKTQEIAKKHGAKIILEKRKGYGRAYKTGMSKATGDIIVTGDADATYPFNRIHKYIQLLLDEDLDFIRRRFYEHLSNVSVDEKPINKIVDEMSNFGITTGYNGLLSSNKPFEIKDKSRYDIYIREKLLNPVINSLLGENVTTIKFDVMPSKLSEVKTELGIKCPNGCEDGVCIKE